MNRAIHDTRRARGHDGVLELTRASHHAECVICGTEHPSGLRLRFRAPQPGQVVAFFSCSQVFQGYPAMLHGGVTAAILDDAMANCLFSLGVAGVTGELVVRYETPVQLGGSAQVRAELIRSCDPVYHLKAELRQEGVLCVSATARFLDKVWASESWALAGPSAGAA